MKRGKTPFGTDLASVVLQMSTLKIGIQQEIGLLNILNTMTHAQEEFYSLKALIKKANALSSSVGKSAPFIAEPPAELV